MRNDALDRHLISTAADDFRLLVFHEDAGAIVAVTAHERNFIVVAGPERDPVPGSYFMVAAITDRFRDGLAPDGRPLVAALLDATFEDIRSRGRGEWVSMMVRSGNADGDGVVRRLGATHVGRDGEDDVYVLHLD